MTINTIHEGMIFIDKLVANPVYVCMCIHHAYTACMHMYTHAHTHAHTLTAILRS